VSHWGAFASIFGHAPHVFRCRLPFGFRWVGVYYEIHRGLSSQMISCHQAQQSATLNMAGLMSHPSPDSIHSARINPSCCANYNVLRLAGLSAPSLGQQCWSMPLLKAIWSLFRNSDVSNSCLPCVFRPLLSHYLLYNYRVYLCVIPVCFGISHHLSSPSFAFQPPPPLFEDVLIRF